MIHLSSEMLNAGLQTRLVLRWHLGTIYHENFEWGDARLQFET